MKGGFYMVASSLVLCNNILHRAKQEGIPITPMKLQKLMYFVCKEYLQSTGQPLISENFGVWQYGPVLRSVYDEFRSFGARKITEYAKDARGRSSVVDEDCNPALRTALDKVWNRYRRCSAIDLSNITHREGSGWSRAYDREDSIITMEDIESDTVG